MIRNFNVDRWLVLFVLPGGAASEVHASAASGDQEDRQIPSTGSDLLFPLEPVEVGGVPGRRGVIGGVSHGTAHAAPPGKVPAFNG